MTCDTGNVLGLTVENPDGNSFGKVGNVPQKPMGKSCSVGASGDIAAGCTPHILLWSLSLIYCHFFGEVTNTLQEKMTMKPISLSTSPTILWPQCCPHFPQGWSSGRVEPSGLSPWCLSFFYLNLQQFYAYVVLFFCHLLSSGMAQLAHKLYMRMTWTPLTKWGTLHCISIETYFPFQGPPHPWRLLCLRIGLLPKASPCCSVPHCLKWQRLAQGAARKLGRVNELMIFRTWSLKVETLRDLNEETQMGSMNRVYCSRIFSQTLTHTTKLKLFRI